MDFLSPQQISVGDFPYIFKRDIAIDELADSRDCFVGKLCLLTDVDDMLHLGPCCRGNGYQHLLCLQAQGMLRQLINQTNHRYSMDPGGDLILVIIDQADSRIGETVILFELPQYFFCCGTRANQEQLFFRPVY